MKVKLVKVVTKEDYDKVSKQLLDYVAKHNLSLSDIRSSMSVSGHIDTKSHALKSIDKQIDTSSIKAMNASIAQYGDDIKYLMRTPYKLMYIDNMDGLRRASIPQIKLALKKAKALAKFRSNPKVKDIKNVLYVGKGRLPSLDNLLLSKKLASDRNTIRTAMKMLEDLANTYHTSTEGVDEHFGNWTEDSQDSILASVDWLLGFYTNDPENAEIIESYANEHHAKYVNIEGEIHISTVAPSDVIGGLIDLKDYVLDNANK